jgi:hypothetical protein
MDTVRTAVYQFFSYVPQEEFNRVFNNFVATVYNDRTYIYDYEAESFSESFGLHVYGGSVVAAWRAYERQAKGGPSAQAVYSHRLTANAKLYADQDFNATVAANLSRGTVVHIDGYGEYTDLDGETAKWAQVTTESGQTGWVFSGFLEERPK